MKSCQWICKFGAAPMHCDSIALCSRTLANVVNQINARYESRLLLSKRAPGGNQLSWRIVLPTPVIFLDRCSHYTEIVLVTFGKRCFPSTARDKDFGSVPCPRGRRTGGKMTQSWPKRDRGLANRLLFSIRRDLSLVRVQSQPSMTDGALTR